MNNKSGLLSIANKLPDKPGVYFFKSEGKIIYIGKAVSLKKRVRSYFSPVPKPLRTSHLVEKIDNIEYTVTDSEKSALILENELIKKNQPKYNVDLKDDKTYPYLKLTCQEEFPRLFFVRKKQDDGAKYYGPFIQTRDLRNFLKFINQLFPLRTCRERLKDKKPCLNYFIKRCVGPCRGKIDSIIYMELVANLNKILEGNCKEVLQDLEKKMNHASKEERFEDAAYYRDYLFSLRNLIEKQDALVARKRKDFNAPKYKKRDDNDIPEKLSKALNISKPVRIIEAFDISNTAGENPGGSMVHFKDGLADKNEYRRFKIKTVDGIDDPGMIKEIVYRRYKRIQEEGTKFPDLILIDGGITQVNSAYSALKTLKIAKIPIFGLAKKEEKLFRPFESIPIELPYDSIELNYLKRIRDEAHRFALKYHKLRRAKSFMPNE